MIHPILTHQGQDLVSMQYRWVEPHKWRDKIHSKWHCQSKQTSAFHAQWNPQPLCRTASMVTQACNNQQYSDQFKLSDTSSTLIFISDTRRQRKGSVYITVFMMLPNPNTGWIKRKNSNGIRRNKFLEMFQVSMWNRNGNKTDDWMKKKTLCRQQEIKN